MNEEDFVIEDGVLVSYNGSERHVVCPYGITEIGENAFDENDKLVSVIIPDTVKKIGKLAFYDCEYLQKIEIPDSVNTIERCAFFNTALRNYEHKLFSIKNGLYIENQTVKYVTNLHQYEIKIPDGVKTIGKHSFSGLSDIRIVHIPDSVVTIEEYAFYDCKKLSQINIPSSVVSIEERAFSSCKRLNLCVPETVQKIGTKAFLKSNTNNVNHKCMHIADGLVVEGNVLKYLNDYTLKNVVIPDFITSIEAYAFCDAVNLESVKIPDGLTLIGESAFANCKKLSTINVPDSVQTIGQKAFRNTCVKNLNNKCHTIKDGFYIENSEIIYFADYSAKKVIIPEGVTKIGKFAFNGCQNLEEIIIPDSVTTIEEGAFSETDLKNVQIPARVTSIGEGAFYFCDLTDETRALLRTFGYDEE